MFDRILHAGYLTSDLAKAVGWFERALGGANAGGGTMAASRVVPGGGINAFVRFGGAEVELMQPADTRSLPGDTLVLHHVGYVVADMAGAAAAAKARGLSFLAEKPFTNPMGQEVLYFDPDTTNGVLMHLTRVPPSPPPASAPSPDIAAILHPGYLVPDAEAAARWYVDKFAGRYLGGGRSRRGGRIAFVDCGGAQIELIEPEQAMAAGEPHVLDHVGYLSRSLDADIAACRRRGLRFATDAAAQNPIGQRVIYLDTASSMGSRMHLTELPR